MKTFASILNRNRGLVYALFGLAATTAFAEPADIDGMYFHPAASMYIQGEMAGASNLVVKGLTLYPDDGKLKRLKELLDQQQEQEQNQDQQNQDQQQNQDDQEQQDQNQEQQQQDPEDQNEEPQANEPQQESEPPSAEKMSEDEAEQLLDAMRQEEQNKRMQLHPVHGRPVKVDKDW